MDSSMYVGIFRVTIEVLFSLKKCLVLDLLFHFDANNDRGAWSPRSFGVFANFSKIGGISSQRQAYLWMK